MQRKRWRAEAAVALGIMPAGSLWCVQLPSDRKRCSVLSCLGMS